MKSNSEVSSQCEASLVLLSFVVVARCLEPHRRKLWGHACVAERVHELDRPVRRKFPGLSSLAASVRTNDDDWTAAGDQFSAGKLNRYFCALLPEDRHYATARRFLNLPPMRGAMTASSPMSSSRAIVSAASERRSVSTVLDGRMPLRCSEWATFATAISP